MRAVINGEWTVYCILSFFFLSFFLFLTLCFFRQNDENTFGFETPSKSACKSLYKCCSQHLAFFRLVQMSGPLLTSATITATTGNHNNNSIGSKFLKLSGAAAPTTATVGQQSHSPPQFRRMPSRRHQRRIVDGASHRKTFFALFLLPSLSLSTFIHYSFLPNPSESLDICIIIFVLFLACLSLIWPADDIYFFFPCFVVLVAVGFFSSLSFFILFRVVCCCLRLAGNMWLYLSYMFSLEMLGMSVP